MKKVVLYTILAAGLGAGIYLSTDEPAIKTSAGTSQGAGAAAESFAHVSLERDALRDRVASLQEELTRVNREVTELAASRAAGTPLKSQDSTASSARSGKLESADPFAKSVQALAGRAAELNQYFQKMTGKEIPELQFLSEGDWINLAKNANFENEESIRKTLAEVRQQAKRNFAPSVWGAITKFAEANGGQIPSDMTQLKTFFDSPVDEGLLQRYQLVQPGTHPELALLQPPIFQEISPVDSEYDTIMFVGRNGHQVVPIVKTPAK
ncbi:MAG: hypothetical protein WCO60_14665 [Verrucomicrobiota bacterium]